MTARIAFVTEVPTSYRDPLFARISREPDLEIEVIYCTEREDGRDWLVEKQTFPHHFLKSYSLWARKRDGFVLKASPGVWRRLSEGRIDAVITGGYLQPTMQLAMLWCKLHEVPYLILSESHNLNRRPFLRRFFKTPLIRAAVSGAASFLVMSARSRDYLVSYGADPDRIFRFPNTPDVAELQRQVLKWKAQRQDVRRELGLGAGTVILYLGRLVEAKDVQLLLRAFQILEDKCPGAELVIAGEGPQRAILENLARDLGLRRCHFLGLVQPDDAPRIYAVADIFALPSREEPWGVVVLEAMACGLPVVVSDKVGARDLVDEGDTGFVLPAGDARVWADALGALEADPARRLRLGANGAETIRRNDYEMCVHELRRALCAAGVSR